MGENALQYLKDHGWQLTAIALGLFLFLAMLLKFADQKRSRSVRQT